MRTLASPKQTVKARAAATELLDMIDELPERNRKFAVSISKNVLRYTPTEKQANWVLKLLSEAVTPEEEKPTVEVGNLKGLVTLFESANAKYPKLTVKTDNNTLKMALCGSRSKTPGWVTLTDGRPYGDNTWYGRVSPEGVWEQSFNGTNAAEWITPIMERFATNAEAAAKRYAKHSGSCVFCNRPLTDESDGKSLDVGYGPVCAKKWNLPWGAS